MKHLTLILLVSASFTACMTEQDKVAWNETKDLFSSDGVAAEAVAEIKAEKEPGKVAEGEKIQMKARAKSAKAPQKSIQATTGR